MEFHGSPTPPEQSSDAPITPAPRFRCLLCPDQAVALDDVALRFAGGRVVCQRCFARETDSERALPADLRAAVRDILHATVNDVFGDDPAICVICNAPIHHQAFAVRLAAGRGVCEDCADAPAGRVVLSGERFIRDLQAGGAGVYRCVVCDGRTTVAISSYRLNGLGLCPDCKATVLGRKLDEGGTFLSDFLRERGFKTSGTPPSDPWADLE